jgi:hypothetical protein
MKFVYVLSLVLGLSMFANAEGHGGEKREQFKAMREKVANACSQELAAAGCEQGKGAMKCVKKFYKENKASGAQISETCKSAIKEMRALRKEKRGSNATAQGENS